MGRKFVRVFHWVASGTMRRSAGTGRTYVRTAGRIVRASPRGVQMNPVVLLDEVDKVGSDYRGEQAAACSRCSTRAEKPHLSATTTSSPPRPVRRVFLGHGERADAIPGPMIDGGTGSLDGRLTGDEKVAIGRDHC